MKSLRFIFIFFNVILLSSVGSFSCTKRDDTEAVVKIEASKIEAQSQISQGAKTLDPALARKKRLNEIVQLLASIETETLRLISESIRYTQFQVLAFALDQDLGVKRSNPGFFCHQFKVYWGEVNIQVDSICENPHQRLVEIKFADSQIDFTFFSSKWAPVIGDFQAMTRPDRFCSGVLSNTKENSKLKSFDCKNTVYLTNDKNSEELRLDQYSYNTSGGQSVDLSGGIFRDLAKRREVKLHVPVDGVIQIIEKELKVRDDFEHLLKK